MIKISIAAKCQRTGNQQQQTRTKKAQTNKQLIAICIFT